MPLSPAGGDQGLLNTYFSDWATRDISRHLPFLYNMTASATYTYLPAFLRSEADNSRPTEDAHSLLICYGKL